MANPFRPYRPAGFSHIPWIGFREGGQGDDSIPTAFLVVLTSWLCILFISFGLFSPRNATVIAVLFVCAMSVSGAVLLIVDLDEPFGGLIQISSSPLRAALAQLAN
jgi:hypothetical protein